MKTVCLFGIYDINYSRNRVIKSGLLGNNYNVIECKVDPKKFRGIKKYFELYKEYRKLQNKNPEYIFVMFPGHSVVWLAYILFGKKIIFDAFVSLYNSNVEDRRLYSPLSLRGLRDYLYDFYSIRLPSLVLLDTNAHIDYFTRKFNVKKEKFIRLFVGSESTANFDFGNKTYQQDFIVHFHGNYIPLQGIDKIIKSISIIKESGKIDFFKFRFVGNGQEYDRIISLARKLNCFSDIEFIDKVPFDKLMSYIYESKIVLGIFGNGIKSSMVIPNKVYEGISLGKVVITMDSSAIKELFTDNENILLVDKDRPEHLAGMIMKLRDDRGLFNKIETGAKNIRYRILPGRLIHDLMKDIDNRKCLK